MAKIYGNIATRDNTHTIKVSIYNKTLNKPSINIDASKSVKFADNPVTITQQQDDTFEHILKTQCKIRLVTKQWLGDYLFASNYSSIVVNVWVDNHCVFCGYVTPHTYNQNYSHLWEEVEINCVDLLSTLKDRRLTDIQSYDELTAQSCVRPFSWFIGNMDLDTKTVVIPNFPDIDYGEAEMMWYEVDWERIVNPDGSITYYGIEAEIIVLDEETAMNTGEMRQGEEKEVTWIESDTDTCIVDGISYWKEYAWIVVCGEDVNTGDWRIGSNAGGMPEVVSTRNEIDGWTTGVLPMPFDFYEHYTTYNVYDNGMEMAASDGIGDQIPLAPSTTTNGSYYEFRQGSDTDLDVDETTGIQYYKDYAWVCVNNECENSGQWQRGNKYYGNDYFTIEATTNGDVTISLKLLTSTDLEYVSYSTDLENWNATYCDGTTKTITVPLTSGDKLYLKGSGKRYIHTISIANSVINSTCDIKAYGNIMSLLYGDNFADKVSLPNYAYTFLSLFKGNTNLKDISNLVLPATTLSVACYDGMFWGCTSITSAPALPATTLKDGCYECMFRDCTSLTTTPELPATTMKLGSYGLMFAGCTSLTSAPALPATTLDEKCYSSMFEGCTSLTSAPALPATTLKDYCYERMFYGCTSLISAPALPATTLEEHCYDFMFDGCTSLVSAPVLAATTMKNCCYRYMFAGCTSLVSAPALPATVLANECYFTMFAGCTSLTSAPALEATTLATKCYLSMFYNCSNLSSITMLATDISATDCLKNWVVGVAASGTFTKDASMTTLPTGDNGIPSGWTVQDAQ